MTNEKFNESENMYSNLEGKIIGNYRILEKIGQGGFAKTYKAEHITLKKFACIKHNISQEDTEILKGEAEKIWDFRHHALPAIRDIIELPDKTLALIMSYIPGPTLEQLTRKHQQVDPEHVAWITGRVLDALRYIHFRGVVHGDVKPQNIIVQPEEHTAALVDYGLSIVKPKITDSSKGHTPLFSAPEQNSSMPPIVETDIYCLGLTMIYALGGNVNKRQIPESTPEPMKEFIKKMIVYDALNRPNWIKCDLLEELYQVREKSFGRRRSNMAKL